MRTFICLLLFAACSTQQQPTLIRTVPPALLNPAVTQQTIHQTICVPGWTATVRPPTSYTEPLKIQKLRSYGYKDQNPSHYELDHQIALEIGGAPTNPANLWPEPHSVSFKDDALENSLHAKICRGAETLDAARQALYVVKVAHGYHG